MNIKFYKTDEVKSPERGTVESAGIDFFIPEDFESTLVEAGYNVLIPSRIKVSIPKGTALIAFNKSGVAAKRNLVVGACVIDSDYTGEVHFDIHNIGTVGQLLEAGQKICQFIQVPIVLSEVIESNNIDDMWERLSERGEGGFGSTGSV